MFSKIFFKINLLTLLSLLLLVLLAPPTHAQNSISTTTKPETQKTLKVGMVTVKPFVFKDGGEYNGMAADLWKQVAKKNNWKSEYIDAGQDYQKATDDLAAGKYDVKGAIPVPVEGTQQAFETYIKNPKLYDGFAADYPVNLYFLKTSGIPNLFISKFKIQNDELVFYTPKQSPYLYKIDKSILELQDSMFSQLVCQQYLGKDSYDCVM